MKTLTFDEFLQMPAGTIFMWDRPTDHNRDTRLCRKWATAYDPDALDDGDGFGWEDLVESEIDPDHIPYWSARFTSRDAKFRIPERGDLDVLAATLGRLPVLS